MNITQNVSSHYCLLQIKRKVETLSAMLFVSENSLSSGWLVSKNYKILMNIFYREMQTELSLIYTLHAARNVYKPVSRQARQVCVTNAVPELYQSCTSHALTPHSAQILKYDDRNVFLHRKTLRQKNVY